jgi:hypothetical protein
MRGLTIALALALASLLLILWVLAADPTGLFYTRSCPVPDANGHIPQAARDAGCSP